MRLIQLTPCCNPSIANRKLRKLLIKIVTPFRLQRKRYGDKKGVERDYVKESGNGKRLIHIQFPCLSEHNIHPIGCVRIKNPLNFMYNTRQTYSVFCTVL